MSEILDFALGKINAQVLFFLNKSFAKSTIETALWKRSTIFCCLEICFQSLCVYRFWSTFLFLLTLSPKQIPCTAGLSRSNKAVAPEFVCKWKPPTPNPPPRPTKVSTSTPAKLTIKAAVLVGGRGTQEPTRGSSTRGFDVVKMVDFSATL